MSSNTTTPVAAGHAHVLLDDLHLDDTPPARPQEHRIDVFVQACIIAVAV
jgi:hypothetical protein